VADVKRLKQLASLSKSQSQQWQDSERAAGTAVGGGVLVERPFNEHRASMVLTTSAWMHPRVNKYIVLWVNPSQMSWKFPKRESVSKTAAGAIRNTWRNRFRGTYFDEPTLDITFQSGNIMPGANIRQDIFGDRHIMQSSYTDDETGETSKKVENFRANNGSPYISQLMQEPPIPPGLQNFYDFLGMIDQPILGPQGENRHILYYRTRVFPRMRVEGYFSPEGVTMAESTENGNRFTWSAQMQVYRTSPPFWKPEEMKMAYSNAIREAGISGELFPRGFNSQAFAQNVQETDNYNPLQPSTWNALLQPESFRKPPALVNKQGDDAVYQKKLIETTNKETSANFQKTIDAFVKKYELKEPLKSKFIADMRKAERQYIGDGSYAPRSRTNEAAQLILQSAQFSNPQ